MSQRLSKSRVLPARSIRGEIRIPGDKSLSHRAGFLGALSTQGIEVTNFSPGADCASTLACLEQLGCDVAREGDRVKVSRGRGIRETEGTLDAGNSGTTARLMCGLLAGIPGAFSVISGDESLRRRPMSRVVDPLRTLGARIDGRDGGRCLPLSIRGTRLCGGNYLLPVPSAQIKTALLLAGLSAQGSVTVTEPVPTRDHTEIMLEYLGVPIRREGSSITVYPFEDLPGGSWRIPGDFSSAAFWIVAAALLPDSDLILRDVGLNPTRTGMLDILRRMGLNVQIGSPSLSGGEKMGDLRVKGTGLAAVSIDAENVPALVDELPVLAVAATRAEGVTEIRGAGELRVKECDRISSMTEGLRALGADLDEHDDGWTIRGGRKLHGGSVSSYGDHRIAMALAIAGLAADGPVEIDDAACVSISYPGFFDQLAAVVQRGESPG
ncbi:MAG: 3-phosphoshikimate 1-carboxyvinyltransferase [Thermovirgaceae bacterium]|nr:3-phosphoshikimate 1-carboxyvinyltransferase [Thermovirgaceae bacterium]